MSGLLDTILGRPVTTGMVCIAVCCGGIIALSNLPVNAASSVERPALTVLALWNKTSPESVERYVTRPVEELAGSIKGVESISSWSGPGFARVMIGLHAGADANVARIDLSERLARIASTLPVGVTIPRVEPYLPREAQREREFLGYVLSGPWSARELALYAEREILPRLTRINGVRQAAVEGGRETEIRIVLSGAALKEFGLTTASVRDRLEEAYPGLLSCRAASTQEELPLSIRGVIEHPEDLLETNVGDPKSGIRLRSCGSVVQSLSAADVIHRVNGRPAVVLRIEKDSGVDALTVASAARGAMEEVEGLLPKGLFLEQCVDATSQLRGDLRELAHEGGISCLFVFLLLGAFFGSSRVAVVVVASVVVAAAATLGFLWLSGRELNFFSMAGLVTGMGRIVDDGLVVVESIQRQGGDVRRGVRRIGCAVAGSTAATIGALIPVRFLPEEIRLPLSDFCLAVGSSLAVSVVASFTLVPVLMDRLTDRHGDGPWAFRLRSGLERMYVALLGKVLAHKKVTILAVVWLFGFPVWLLPDRIAVPGMLSLTYNATIGSAWFAGFRQHLDVVLGGVVYQFIRGVPQDDGAVPGEDTGLFVEARLPAGSGIEAADSMAMVFEQEALRNGRHVRTVRSRVQGDAGEVRVEFDAAAGQAGVAAEVKNRLTGLAARLGGAKIAVAGFGPGFSTGGEEVSQFRVVVKGYSYATVKEIAEEFRKRAMQQPHVGEVDIDRVSGSEEKVNEIVLVPDREALARQGLTIEWLVREIQPYTGGAGETVLEEGVPGVRCSLHLDEARGLSVERLGSLPLQMPGGRFCSVSDVAKLRSRRVQGVIVRKDQRYIRWVSFTFRGPYRYGQAFLLCLLGSMNPPDGYTIAPDERFEADSGIEQRALLPICAAALVVVFMVAASLYESLVIPLVVMLAVPCSLIGVMGVFILMRLPWGKGGAASVFFLIGIVVSNAIVLVDVLQRRCRGGDLSAIAQAAAERVRPVIMTTLTTAAAFVPMFVRGRPGGFWFSFALGSFGGILSASLLSLCVIPSVFVVLQRFSRKGRAASTIA
jgi:multidrug efflux pump subunit AcrB